MGTRATIARKTGENTFQGVYHHWDGYPSALGATLFDVHKTHFKNDLGAMLQYLIDDHPAGWSTINGADFTKAPGFEEKGFNTSGPHCYCHGGRHEKSNILTQENASDCGCEYAYVFDQSDNTMQVLSSVYANGDKMIGMFGFGAPSDKVRWQILATVDLNGKAPKWDKL